MIIPDIEENWPGRVNTVTIGATKSEGGTRGRTVTIGGASGIPFLSFDGEMHTDLPLLQRTFSQGIAR